MELVILLSVVDASIAFTIAETKLFESLRALIKAKCSLFGELFLVDTALVIG
jgi:hypothetical protein